MKSPYRALIVPAATRHGLDPILVEAVIWQESAGQADAFRFEPAFWERYCKEDPRFTGEEPRRISSSYGLMQIMYPTALDHGYIGPPEGLFDLQINIDLGCLILYRLSQRWEGDLIKILASYNGGVGGVDRPGPRAYAIRVKDRYDRLTTARACLDRTGRRA